MTRWVLVVALAGCNQLYGLDETIGPPPLDSDSDGIPDEDDNCVLVANVDQHNADSDTFGDACDPCPMGPQSGVDADEDGVDDTCDACPLGPNHDEDGDGLFDACDNCPGDANHTPKDDQTDGDGDGVGDACDGSPALNQRVFFDAFAPEPDPQWNSGFAVWMGTGEGYAPVEPPTSNALGPWNRRGAVSGTHWHLTTVIDVPAAPPNNMRIGIASVEQTQNLPAPACELYYDELDKLWHEAEAGKPVTVASPLRITMRLEATGQVSLGLHCTYGTQPFDSTQNYFQGTFFPMLLLRGATAEFHYVDSVQ